MTTANTQPILTVAIPTYHRNAILREHLAFLLPQLTAQCRLLIIDNSSPTPVIDTIRDDLQARPGLDVRIERNPVNIGGAANILRCVELCETEWLWVLSDDDKPRPDAIATIVANIEIRPQCLCFNYAIASGLRTRTFVSSGLDEFVDKIDDFGNVVFISTNVFRASALLTSLRYGYIYSYSWAPLVATLLHALGNRGQCCFTVDQIVDYVATDQKRWSYINWGLGMGTLLDAPMGQKTRMRLAKSIVRSVAYLDFAVLIELAAAIKTGQMKRNEARFLHDQICRRIYYFERNPVRRLRILGFRTLLLWPRVSHWSCLAGLRFVRRWKGKSENVDGFVAPDRLSCG